MSATICYLYSRFSSRAQEQGASLARQRERGEQFAKKKGWILAECNRFVDEAKSGFDGANQAEHSALGKFLRGIANKIVQPGSVLLVESIDRLSRQDPWTHFGLLKQIIDGGVTVITLHDEVEYSLQTLQEDARLMSYLNHDMVRAYKESALKAERVADAWHRKRQSNELMTARCPAWLCVIEKDGKRQFQKREDRCVIVNHIFEMAAQGLGKMLIAKRLNERGVCSWGTGKRDRKGRGTGWLQSYIQKILHSRAVLGEFQPHKLARDKKRVAHGEAKSGYFPPVISEELSCGRMVNEDGINCLRGEKAKA